MEGKEDKEEDETGRRVGWRGRRWVARRGEGIMICRRVVRRLQLPFSVVGG